LGTVLPGAAEWVAAFASTPLEPPTEALLARLAAAELRVLLPVFDPDLLGPAAASAWGEVTAVTCALPAGRPGRPALPPEPWLDASGLGRCSLVLVPALAVDRAGTRLGQGGGWYDRALRFAAPDALLLGVCFPWEVVAAGELPRDTHDVPLHGVLTMAGVELFAK
jgi:5-formyltetrahydrofolate cyclo-ligase